MISINSNFSDNFNTFDYLVGLVKMWVELVRLGSNSTARQVDILS